MTAPDRELPFKLNTPANQLAKNLGRRLRYLRAQAGITQLELAKKASMDRTYLCRLERGKILPRYDVLVRLAESLGVSVTEIVRSTK